MSVMGMMMVMMQVVRHAGLRPVEWREYSTRTESGNYTEIGHNLSVTASADRKTASVE